LQFDGKDVTEFTGLSPNEINNAVDYLEGERFTSESHLRDLEAMIARTIEKKRRVRKEDPSAKHAPFSLDCL
jgi:hypothetical protein